ncbi:MAG: alkaline phosphatase family protein [Actinomycetota bacterium]
MHSDSLADDASAVLLGDALAHVVDMVLVRGDGRFEAHTREGSVSARRDGTIEWARNRNPLERQDAGAFRPLEREIAHVRPPSHTNHYPDAYDRIGQLFEDPRAPDLVVLHAPAHNWEERGGHRGEHGSLDLVQSRAPLILAGAGLGRLGRLERSARMVDIAPTLARLAGVHAASDGRLLRAQEGRVLEEALDPDAFAKNVVAFLCDGTNANVLYAMADAGELPCIARLMSEGTTYGHGCISSFPSVTLANHTTALTGAHPGRHGILHNYYFDRAARRQIKANEPATWHQAREEIRADVETLFEAVARSGGGFTAAVNEPCDRGAGYATFDLVRAAGVGGIAGALPDARGLPDTTEMFAATPGGYAWASSADHIAVRQAIDVWLGVAGNPRPRVMWINLILPDAAAHAGGPYSEIARAGLRDTDRRIARILDALDWGNGETAFVVLADHGMEETDPECKGDFDEALARAGIPFRDEGYGFIYLGE